MGCDIHVNYEVKMGSGGWERINWEDEFIRKMRIDEDGTQWPEWDFNKMGESVYYISRNYFLFSILADVRNYCDMVPISSPRGLPKDVSQDTLTKSKEFGCDGHSHSWLSLEELLAYDWDRTVLLDGVVNEEEYRQWKEKGAPESYCAGVSGGRVCFVTQEEMEDLVTGVVVPDPYLSYYTSVEWEHSYRQCVGEKFFITLNHLSNIPGSVRLVFWFDC